jgi:hypothetical protein
MALAPHVTRSSTAAKGSSFVLISSGNGTLVTSA